MTKKIPSPPKLPNLLEKIRESIETGNYILSDHALKMQNKRTITLPAVLYVLKTGHEEKGKTCFDEQWNAWKYAIRGKTKDELNVRIIVAFDENKMVIITVMHIGGL